MGNLITVGGHTFDPTLLTDGVIIDVGCRGFEFADYFIGKKTFAIDPDGAVFIASEDAIPDEFGLYLSPHHLICAAISDKAGDSEIYENGEATCLKQRHHHQDHRIKPCKTITMEDLYKITGENVDILKLDCEGAEYIILGETFKPIPKQITVEFHHHCVPEMHNKYLPGILVNLLKDYNVHNFVWETKHGAGFNYWDVLFIRKDIWQS